MTQEPLNITYSLQEILGEIKQSIKETNQKLDKLDDRFTKVEIELAEIKADVKGIDKRLEKVEGTQRNQVWALIILLASAILTAGARLFFTPIS